MNTLPPLVDNEVETNTLPPLNEGDKNESSITKETKAKKFSYATDGSFDKATEYVNYLNSGLEAVLREKEAVKRASELEFARLTAVKELSSQENLPEDKKEILKSLVKSSPSPITLNPDIIFEEKYAQNAINTSFAMGDNPIVNEQIEITPEAVYQAMDLGQNNIAIREIVHNKTLEVNDKLSREGWGEFGLNFGSFLIPMYEEYNLNTSVGEAIPETYFLGGNLKQEIIDYIFSLPAEEAKKEIDRIYDDLGNNSLLQKTFLDSLALFTTNDKFLSNTFSVLDIGTAGLSGAKYAITGTVMAANLGSRAVIRGSSALNALGLGGKSAAAYILETLEASRTAKNLRDPMGMYEVMGITAPDAFTDSLRITQNGQYASGTQAYTKITQRLDQLEAAENAVLSSNNIQRLSDDAVKVAIQETLADFEARNVRFDPVNNMRYVPNVSTTQVIKAEDTAENVGYIAVRIADDATGNGFNTISQADLYASRVLKLYDTEYVITNQGQKFFIDHVMPIKENFDEVDELLIRTKNFQSGNILDTFAEIARNPSAWFSGEMNAKLKAATHLPSYLVNQLKTVSGPLNSLAKNPLRKKEYKALQRVLLENQKRAKQVTDPLTGKVRETYGHLNTTQGELDANYFNVVGRLPTQAESLAYWSYKKLSDIDYKIRNAKLYQSKAVLGIKEVAFNIINTANNKAVNMVLEGAPVSKLPTLTGKEFKVAIVNPTGGILVKSSHNLDKTPRAGMSVDLADMQKMIDEQGYRLIQLAQPDTKPLRNVGQTDERIDFVLVQSHVEKNLPLKQVDYNPHHYQYVKDRFVQQAGVKASVTGEKSTQTNTYIVASTDAEAKQWASAMDEARRLLKKYNTSNNPQDLSAFKDYVRANLPDDADWIKSQYEPVLDPSGQKVADPVWDIDSPWANVRYGDDVAKITERELRAIHGDALRTSNDYEFDMMADINKKFLGEKTAKLLEVNSGARRTQMAEVIDPMQSLTEGMRNVIRGKVMDDAKKFALRSWVNEFGSLFDVPIEEVRKNPTFYFFNGALRENATDRNLLNRAKASKKALENFFGIYSETNTRFDMFANWLADSVYTRLGQRSADLLTSSQLMKTKDPFAFARSFAFNTKMGFLNPRQYFMGVQTVYHSALIVGDPIIALRGTASHMLSNSLRANNSKSVREFVNKAAQKIGWKGTDFLEAHDAMVKAGIDVVEGEAAMWDNFMDYKLFKGNTGAFLDAGLLPFRAGDRINRMSAWHMAYLEWRKANPNAKLDQKAIDGILNRQNILTNNMTRKDSAGMQQKGLSLLTQFWGYNMKLTEAYLGTQLTAAEKLRLLVGYSAMYGIPMGVQSASLPVNLISTGLQASGLQPTAPYGGAGGSTNIYKDYKTTEQYYSLDEMFKDNPLYNVAINGILGTLVEEVTGRKTDITSSFGPGALQILADTAEGRLELVKLSASSSIIADAFSNTMPLLKTIYNAVTAGQLPNPNRTLQDFARSISVISTFNNLQKAYIIVSEGVRRSKDGRITQDDQDAIDAALSILGVSNEDVQKLFLEGDINKYNDDLSNKIIKEYNSAVANYLKFADTDPDLAKTYEDTANDLVEQLNEIAPDKMSLLPLAWSNNTWEDVMQMKKEKRKVIQEGNQ